MYSVRTENVVEANLPAKNAIIALLDSCTSDSL
jgi:hypothetical protein